MNHDPNKELIVLVDNEGNPIGTAPKLASHHASTPLHLAFSVFIFDTKGRILVTQRAHSKKVWPGVWTGSCCGHPAPNEAMTEAIKRRTHYELGMNIKNIRVLLPNYRYKTPPFKGIIEHEVCPVYTALAVDDPKPNPDEVEAYEWLSWDDLLTKALKDTDDTWSWWCKDQLKQLANLESVQPYQNDN